MAGKAIIFCAPSGSGKTTIVKHLLQNNPDLGFSISASTRDRRGRTEQDGKDYYFLSPEEFKEKIVNNEFIEWEEVYEGNYYGTLKEEIERVWKNGKNVIFDVDVKGGLNLKKYFGDKALAIFVKVPTLEGQSSIKSPAGTQGGTVFRLREKGMPSLSNGRRGDLNVRVQVEVPTKLSGDQQDKLREFASSIGDHNSPMQEGFLEKAKRFFDL